MCALPKSIQSVSIFNHFALLLGLTCLLSSQTHLLRSTIWLVYIKFNGGAI